MGKRENSGVFSEAIAAIDMKVGICRQLIEFMKVCEYWRSRSFLYHIFSRFCMFCALLGKDIRWAFTGPLVLWFRLSRANWHVCSKRSLNSITHWYVDSTCSPFTSPDHNSLKIAMGPRTLRPYSNSNGENPNDSCRTSLMAKSKAGRYLSQSLGRSAHILRSISFIVAWKRSTKPLHIGWYGVVVNCWSDRSLLTSFITSAVNWDPQSVSISSGIPTLLNILTNASATCSVSILGNATASGYLVA